MTPRTRPELADADEHHSERLEFPKWPGHKCDQQGYFRNVQVLAMLMHVKALNKKLTFASMRT